MKLRVLIVLVDYKVLGLEFLAHHSRWGALKVGNYGEFLDSSKEVDVNLFCDPDKGIAFHCSASGGFIRAVEIKIALKELLNNDGPVCLEDVQKSTVNFRSGSSSLSSSLDSGSSSLVSNANISVVTCKPTDNIVSSASERKEYPVDPSIPNIKSSIYGIDEFHLFSFKIGLVPKLIPMVRQSVLLFIWVKMLEEETQESFITVACHVLIFVKGPVSAEIYVNMLMVFLNTGCTLPSIELDRAMMAQLAIVVSTYLPIDLRNFDNFINLQASRLRSSLNARDMPAMELNMSQHFEMYQQQHLVDGLYSTGVYSLRYPNQVTAMPILSSAHKSLLLNQKKISPRNVEPLSPLNSRLSAFINLEKQQQSFHSLSSQELGYKLSDDLG
ncbi:hypothetical protein CRYUN_Cryun11dG0078100 [Craigia yunnanensis]